MNKEDPKKLNEELCMLRKRIKDLEQEQLKTKTIQESEEKYRSLFDSINIGLALHEIVVDENEKPIDFIFLDINPVFEKMIALKKNDIVGKRGLETIPHIKQKQIDVYGKVALSGLPISFIDYSELLNGFVDIKIFSPAKNQFAIATFDITDQIKAKQELILNEEKYRALLENVGAGIGFYDLEGKVVLYNNLAAQHLKGKPEDFIGKSIYEIFGESEGGKYHKRILASAKSKEILEYKDNVVLPKGAQWFHSKYNKIQNKNGQVIGVQIISIDITEIKQNKEKLQRLFDNLNNGFIYCKIVLNKEGKAIDGIFLEVNKAYEQMIGLDSKNIIGNKLSDIKTDIKNDPMKHMGFYHQILSGNPVYFQDYSKERDFWYSVNAYSPQDGYFAALIEDITEHKQAEIARKSASLKLRELNRRFILAADSAGFGIWELDLVHNKLYWDNWMFKIYGIEREDFGEAYEAWKKGVHPLDIERANEEVEQAIRGEKEFDSEFRIIRPDGEVRYIKANAAIVHNKQKQAIRMIGINYDITRIKLAEKELIAAKEKAEESDRLKSAFLANMSHEIRTPMNGILGFANLLNDPELSGNEIKAYSEIIERSGKRMLNIINDLMDISKIEAGQMDVSFSAVNPQDSLEYLFRFFEPEIKNKGLKFYFNNLKTAESVILWTDKEKLIAILSNLIKNAFKYTRKGHIEIGYTIQKNENEESSSIRFYVKDSGIGIPDNRQSAIFERFVQADIEDKTASEGAGLGLAISKAYAEMLHGHVWVESQLGKGSEFYLSIPYQKAKIEINSSSTEKNIALDSQANILKLKILIAEDDETSLEHLTILLADIAQNIIHVNNGKDAVEECRNNPDIDLVLMDLKMPIMNGFEATRCIRSFNSELIIIAQTAYALAGDREKAINAGCTDYISKPINKDKLFELLHFHF